MLPWPPPAIKALRRRRGYTQRQLADLIPCSVSTIKRAEAGTYYPKSPYLRRSLTRVEKSSPDLPRPSPPDHHDPGPVPAKA